MPHAERDDVIGTMVGLAYNYVEPALAEQLLDVLRMANVLEDLLVDTLVRGRTEGQVAGRHEDILSILRARFEGVSTVVQERVQQVSDLSRLAALVTSAATVASLKEFANRLDLVDE